MWKSDLRYWKSRRIVTEEGGTDPLRNDWLGIGAEPKSRGKRTVRNPPSGFPWCRLTAPAPRSPDTREPDDRVSGW